MPRPGPSGIGSLGTVLNCRLREAVLSSGKPQSEPTCTWSARWPHLGFSLRAGRRPRMKQGFKSISMSYLFFTFFTVSRHTRCAAKTYLFLCASSVLLLAQSALQITSPADGTVVSLWADADCDRRGIRRRLSRDDADWGRPYRLRSSAVGATLAVHDSATVRYQPGALCSEGKRRYRGRRRHHIEPHLNRRGAIGRSRRH